MDSSTKTASPFPSRVARGKARSRLEIMVWPGQTRLYVRGREFPQTFGDGDVQDFNQQFVRILDDLRRTVMRKQDLALTIEERDHYLKELRTIGLAAYNKIISPGASQHIAEFEAREQRYGRSLTLTFRTPPSLSLLWEMLYTGAPAGSVDSGQFWGFRYPLGRAYWETDTTEYIQLQSGIFSAIHSELLHSQQEVEQLVRHILHVSQGLGLKLTVCLLDEDESIVAGTFSPEWLMERFHSDDFRYGIVHFACHCENPAGAGASQAYLRLTARECDLEMRLEQLTAWKGYGFVYQPLVFLNACESATTGHMLQMLNFPSGFLDFGAGGVVAASCTLPDHFAGAFAVEFYKRLLDKERPATVGEALLETRLHFLEHFNNPLGLAYGLYAESFQQLLLTE
jgi:hypothetical protein